MATEGEGAKMGDDMTWVPLAIAAAGTTLAWLMSLASRRREEDGSGDRWRNAARFLRPKTYADENAAKRLPHLMMDDGGGYPLGDVDLRLRQSDF